jgi:hypothetical protein
MKPEWVISADLAALSAQGVCLWWAIISQADDEGRLKGDVDALYRFVQPWTAREDVVIALQIMQKRKMVHLYTKSGVTILEITNWSDHQKVDHARPSKYPPFSNGRTSSRNLANPRESSRGFDPRARADQIRSDRSDRSELLSRASRAHEKHLQAIQNELAREDES